MGLVGGNGGRFLNLFGLSKSFKVMRMKARERRE